MTDPERDTETPAPADGPPRWAWFAAAFALAAGVVLGATLQPFHASLSSDDAAQDAETLEDGDIRRADAAPAAIDGDASGPFGLLDAYAPYPALRPAADAVGWRRGRAVDEALRRAFGTCDADGAFFGGSAACATRPNGLAAILRLPSGAVLIEANVHVTLAGGPIACGRSSGPDRCAPAFAYAPDGADGAALRPTTDGLPFLALAGADPVAGRGLADAIGAEPGDVAVVLTGDRAVAAIIGDVGPPDRAVAGSLALFAALGEPRCRERAAAGSGACVDAESAPLPAPALIIVFPGSQIEGLAPTGAWERIAAHAEARLRLLLEQAAP